MAHSLSSILKIVALMSFQAQKELLSNLFENTLCDILCHGSIIIHHSINYMGLRQNNTLGPTYNEFGYNKYPLTANKIPLH